MSTRAKVRTAAQAVGYINRVGFCLLFPIKGLDMPSLYEVVGNTRIKIPMWNEDIERCWTWKDELPRKQRAFFAKYFRGRGTFISLEMLPCFLALHHAPGAPGEFENFYRAGYISSTTRAVWETLAKHGPMAVLELRHACGLASKSGNLRFKKAAEELQRKLIIVHFGTEQETAAWPSGRYELTCRAFPRQVAQARTITKETARARIAAKYLESRPGKSGLQLARIFGWSREEAAVALRQARHTDDS